jgi:hypothetical protein
MTHNTVFIGPELVPNEFPYSGAYYGTFGHKGTEDELQESSILSLMFSRLTKALR